MSHLPWKAVKEVVPGRNGGRIEYLRRYQYVHRKVSGVYRRPSADQHAENDRRADFKGNPGQDQLSDRCGLDYLSLSRATGTLSGGEAQRIRLATQIGSGLVGVAYILDEPSIGLHQRDNDKLLRTLTHLRDLGNSVIVVEHDEDTMRAADCIVDIGPGAGEHGGEVVAIGTAAEIMKCERSITGAYLSGKRKIPVPAKRKKPTGWIRIRGARENNLKNIDVNLPLGVMTCVTGVSGSGKSSLINEILYKSLARQLTGPELLRESMMESTGWNSWIRSSPSTSPHRADAPLQSGDLYGGV